ncbi:hypothetical protein HMPREF1544_02289 [Mucor circinelloides 1006PhL]|uniref:Uncharacterized protein n=1 Tax=Mucor circinelloides f. circinelloides (strain 1006PhL) TaxID=1220926 RepID=S2JKL3_MUCC1|nr:hypothetical protein HMPREF1544_02289 [Mucor circinelloides 1006PhL]
MLTDYYQQEKEKDILKDMYMYQDIIEQYHQDDDEQDDMSGVTVSQHLAPEQYLYEFPTKTCLKALAYLDSEEEEYSFFDESSFFTTDSYTAIESVQHNDDHMNWNENTILVDDGRLSPLQLPAQADIITNIRPRESFVNSSAQSDQPVGPSSFLSDVRKHHMYYRVTPTRTTSYMRKGYSFTSEQEYCDNVPMMDSDSDNTTTTTKSSASSRIVLIKLNKHKQSPMTFVQRCPTSLTYFASDEGYNDDEDDQFDGTEELESRCVFIPLSDDEEDEQDRQWTLQDQAAVKIQSLWRGYRSRCENKQTFSSMRPEQRVFLNLANICTRLHRRQMNTVDERLHQLEQRVRQETAMRIAFEKAMEDMTVLIDQQQKTLYDRVEQEMHMRQLYEEKMNTALAQLQPLESRLRKEVNARTKMEEMMTRVLDQMHESETSRLEQAKQDAESRKMMQAKLDHAMEEIAIIKKQTSSTRSHSSTTTTVNSSSSRPTSAAVRRPALKSSSPSTASSTKASSTASSTTTTTTTTNNTKSSVTPNTTAIRRSVRPSTNNISKKSTNNNTILLERPSVVPSIRRPVLNSRTSTATTPPARRTFLSRT